MAQNSELQREFQAYRREIEYCSYCPKLCRFSCPVAQVEHSETVTPTGKMTLLRLVRDQVMPFDPETADVFYRCTGCLISRTYCEHGIEVPPPFEAARAEAVKSGVAPAPAMRALAAWQEHGNPFGEDLSAVVRRYVPEEYLDGKAEVLVFPGCTTLHYLPVNLQAVVRVLQVLRVDFRVLHQGRICCGNPIQTLGHRETFQAHSRELLARLAGYKIIVSPCPTCVYYLKAVYPRLGLKPAGKVLHISEYAAARLSELTARAAVKKKVLYHDPCHLGRYLGVYDPPRLILEKVTGQKPLEFYEHREAATCCGGGGGVPLTHPQTARAISRNKMRDFKRSKAEVLATACPMCQRMLGRAGREQGAKVEDVMVLLALSLGREE